MLPFELLEVEITVEVPQGANPGENHASVEGGEGPGASAVPGRTLVKPVSVDSQQTPFGIERIGLTPENEGGTIDNQAGSHPFQMTTTLDLNEALEANVKRKAKLRSAPALAKDLQLTLPSGLIGNPQAVAQCSEVDFTAEEGAANACGPTPSSGSPR